MTLRPSRAHALRTGGFVLFALLAPVLVTRVERRLIYFGSFSSPPQSYREVSFTRTLSKPSEIGLLLNLLCDVHHLDCVAPLLQLKI